MSRLDVVAGPNGAGKSTFVRFTLAPKLPGAVVVNADAIAAQRWPDDPAAHAYDAASVAERTRQHLVEQRRPFIAETVFSHPSKLTLVDDAVAAGYFVALHVVMVPEDLAVARVRARVAAGGHDVPVDKITARYQRLWSLVADAVERVDAASFWDNSARRGPLLVARFGGGVPVGHTAWPSWTPVDLTSRWPSS